MSISLLALLCLAQEPSVQDLVKRLTDDSIDEREMAAQELRQLGQKALPHLEKAYKGGDSESRTRLLPTLRWLRAPAVVRKLDPLTPMVRWEIEDGHPIPWITLLRAASKQGPWVPEWRPVTLEEMRYLSRQALKHAAELGEVHVGLHVIKTYRLRSLVPAIEKLVRHENAQLRLATLKTLDALGETLPEKPVLGLLTDDSRRIRQEVMDLAVKHQTKGALETLRGYRDHGDVFDKQTTMSGLCRLRAPEGLTYAEKYFTSKDKSERVRGAFTLAHYRDARAVPVLIDTIENGQQRVAMWAADSLVKMRHKSAIPGLLKLLEKEDYDTRFNVLKVLRALKAREAIPKMLEISESLGKGYQTAAFTLAELGERKVIPIARKWLALESRYSGHRYTAATTLAEIGDQESIPAITRLLEDRDEGVRQAAARALGRLGDTQCIPRLIAMLNEPGRKAQAGAAEALGLLKAKSAKTHLERLTQDLDPTPREAALEALTKLD